MLPPQWKRVWSFLKTLETGLRYDSATLLLDIYPGAEIRILTRSSIIHNSQDRKMTSASTARKTNKENVVYTDGGFTQI